jgi:hypothetical protein
MIVIDRLVVVGDLRLVLLIGRAGMAVAWQSWHGDSGRREPSWKAMPFELEVEAGELMPLQLPALTRWGQLE